MAKRPRHLAGWIASDREYDYPYAPRLEHYFDGTSEYSYCGTIGVWGTARNLAASRRCKRCIMHMLSDGLLRVVGVRQGAW